MLSAASCVGQPPPRVFVFSELLELKLNRVSSFHFISCIGVTNNGITVLGRYLCADDDDYDDDDDDDDDIDISCQPQRLQSDQHTRQSRPQCA